MLAGCAGRRARRPGGSLSLSISIYLCISLSLLLSLSLPLSLPLSPSPSLPPSLSFSLPLSLLSLSLSRSLPLPLPRSLSLILGGSPYGLFTHVDGTSAPSYHRLLIWQGRDQRRPGNRAAALGLGPPGSALRCGLAVRVTCQWLPMRQIRLGEQGLLHAGGRPPLRCRWRQEAMHHCAVRQSCVPSTFAALFIVPRVHLERVVRSRPRAAAAANSSQNATHQSKSHSGRQHCGYCGGNFGAGVRPNITISEIVPVAFDSLRLRFWAPDFYAAPGWGAATPGACPPGQQRSCPPSQRRVPMWCGEAQNGDSCGGGGGGGAASTRRKGEISLRCREQWALFDNIFPHARPRPRLRGTETDTSGASAGTRTRPGGRARRSARCSRGRG